MTSVSQSRTRRDGVALWRQIADVLRDEIERGLHPEGAALPGEIALAERFGVNRHTVRQALRELAGRGLVRPERGRGTIVRGGRLDYPIRQRTRFSEIVSAQAREPEGRLLASRRIEATPEMAGALGLERGATIVSLDTLSLADGEPVSTATHLFDGDRFEALPTHFSNSGSITLALAACGVADYTRLETKITARTASPEEASLLGLRIGAPLLVTEAINAAPDGRPTHLTRARFAADRVQLVVGEAS